MIPSTKVPIMIVAGVIDFLVLITLVIALTFLGLLGTWLGFVIMFFAAPHYPLLTAMTIWIVGVIPLICGVFLLNSAVFVIKTGFDLDLY